MAIAKLNKFNNSTLAVDVEITKQFKLRIFIALKLIALAAFVLGCGIEVNKND